MSATITEIAKLAGVSSATVSRAFREDCYISREKRDEILRIAAEMDYKPKAYRKRQRPESFNNTIAVVAPDIYNSFFRDMIRGIESVTYPKGYELFACDTNEDTTKEIRCLSALSAKKIGGLIVSVVSDMEEYNAAYLEDMNESGIPVVLVDRDIRGSHLDGVFLDDYRGAYQATEALVCKGHRDIAIVCGPTTSRTGVERLNGYIGALRAKGLPVHEEYILYGEYREDMAYNLTKKLLHTQPQVTAVMSSNSIMAGGCMRAIRECNLAIPDDIAFISYGKKDYYDQTGSNISYVARPVHSVGEECAKILLQKMEMGKKSKRQPQKRIVFSMNLFLNGSEAFPKNRK